MKILRQNFEPITNLLVVEVDEWPEPIKINIEGMIEAPTASAIARMVKATIERKKREAAKREMEQRAMANDRPSIQAGRHEARNFGGRA